MSTAAKFPTPRTDKDSECTFAPKPANGPANPANGPANPANGPANLANGPGVYPSAKLAARCSTTGITAPLFGKDTGRTYTSL